MEDGNQNNGEEEIINDLIITEADEDAKKLQDNEQDSSVQKLLFGVDYVDTDKEGVNLKMSKILSLWCQHLTDEEKALRHNICSLIERMINKIRYVASKQKNDRPIHKVS